ncbi:hypothetical protein PSHT_07326 [Puccinia striiformis]|uniref:Uncharacterized protein n=1 Tax=Puccinia striiformis TaxID=27350 RepID=A0A2S4VYS5_9BASI|nr:hypothetical protein PSHT_07326 [Puccinia striiformis]
MSKPASRSGSWNFGSRRTRTDLPPSNPPNGQRRKLDELVGSITKRATNQYFRLQNLFKAADEHDAETQEILRAASVHKDPPVAHRFPSSSNQAKGSYKPPPVHFPPLQTRVQELEQGLGKLELLVQNQCERLSKLEELLPQFNTRDPIRPVAPDTPMSIPPTNQNHLIDPDILMANPPHHVQLGKPVSQGSMSMLHPDFIQSFSNRLDAVEAIFANKEKNKARPKPHKLSRFMGYEDQSTPHKRARF